MLPAGNGCELDRRPRTLSRQGRSRKNVLTGGRVRVRPGDGGAPAASAAGRASQARRREHRPSPGQTARGARISRRSIGADTLAEPVEAACRVRRTLRSRSTQGAFRPRTETNPAAVFRLTYSAPGAIITLTCLLRAFGLHDSSGLHRHTDGALRLPSLAQLEIIPPSAHGTPTPFESAQAKPAVSQ